MSMRFDSYSENTLRYYMELCINCKRCIQVCPHGVFAEGPEHAELVRPESCIECGACAGNCPVQAISVESGVGCAWAMIGAALWGETMGAGCDCCGTDGTCCQTAGTGTDRKGCE